MSLNISNANNSNVDFYNNRGSLLQHLNQLHTRITEIACSIFEKMKQHLFFVVGASGNFLRNIAYEIFNFATNSPSHILQVARLDELITSSNSTDNESHFTAILHEFCAVHRRFHEARGFPKQLSDLKERKLKSFFLQKQKETVAALKVIAKRMESAQYTQVIKKVIGEMSPARVGDIAQQGMIRDMNHTVYCDPQMSPARVSDIAQQGMIRDMDRMVRYDLNSAVNFVQYNRHNAQWDSDDRVFIRDVCKRIMKLERDIDAVREADAGKEVLAADNRVLSGRFNTTIPFHDEYNVVTILSDVSQMTRSHWGFMDFVFLHCPPSDAWTTPEIEAVKRCVIALQHQDREDTEVRQIIHDTFQSGRFFDCNETDRYPTIEDAIEEARKRAYVETDACVLRVLETLRVVRPISFIERV